MDDIKILGEPSLDDIEKYKRGNKENIKLSNYYLCQCWCGNYWVPSKKIIKKDCLVVAGSIRTTIDL